MNKMVSMLGNPETETGTTDLEDNEADEILDD
jgi:hypothetical protein